MRKQLGKYLIEAELGRGGMGVVYRAHQPSLDRTVAIKLLSSDLIGDPDGVRRFRLEAKSVAKLNHPNITQVYDIEEEENLIYLVMEYVDGESLDGLITKSVLTESRCLKIVADIADALHFAHEKGIVHRDVKPANVLMTSDGRVKVADFGLAYLIDREGGTTRTGFLVGSPNYMSPEQATGQKIDRRSDIYSLGVVLFRMLTGRVPFVAESSHAVLFMQVGQEPPDPRELNKSISLVTRGLVLKALNKKPEARFQTMAEFRDALLRQAAALGAGVAGEISMDDGTVALGTARRSRRHRAGLRGRPRHLDAADRRADEGDRADTGPAAGPADAGPRGPLAGSRGSRPRHAAAGATGRSSPLARPSHRDRRRGPLRRRLRRNAPVQERPASRLREPSRSHAGPSPHGRADGRPRPAGPDARARGDGRPDPGSPAPDAGPGADEAARREDPDAPADGAPRDPDRRRPAAADTGPFGRRALCPDEPDELRAGEDEGLRARASTSRAGRRRARPSPMRASSRSSSRCRRESPRRARR